MSQVKGFTIEFRVRSISPKPLGRFSLNFTQMFLSVRQCAEPLTRLHRLKFRVTLQGHVIYPSIVSTPYLGTPLNDLHYTSLKCSSQ